MALISSLPKPTNTHKAANMTVVLVIPGPSNLVEFSTSTAKDNPVKTSNTPNIAHNIM